MREKDRKIIEKLSKNGRMSLSSIAKALKTSHVSVGSRIRNLIDSKLLKIAPLINTKEYKMAVICMETDGNKDFIRKYTDCPRHLFIAKATGAYNLIAGVIAEDLDALEAATDTCTINNNPHVRRTEASIVSRIFPAYQQIRECSKKTKPSCGADCSKCEHFNGKCRGCPQVEKYKKDLA